MNKSSSLLGLSSLFSFVAFGAFGAFACGGATRDPSPAPPGGVNASTLVYKSPCANTVCGSAPSGSASSYTCASKEAACAWEPSASTDSATTVSYRECEDAACADHEASKDCPAGTHFGGLRCGAENDAACSSYATCIPDDLPPVGPPCGADECGPIIEIAEDCGDGTYAGLVCKRNGTVCKPMSGCPTK